jgi:hypothetical protein
MTLHDIIVALRFTSSQLSKQLMDVTCTGGVHATLMKSQRELIHSINELMKLDKEV